MKGSFQAIVIGASAGGLNALTAIIPHLPEHFLPIIIAMHLKPNTETLLIPYLNEQSKLWVKEAACNEQIQEDTVYFAPPAYHLLIEQDRRFSYSVEEPVQFNRPSIDALFESAALAYQSNLIGVILTGANHDGSLGFKAIKERGGLLIAQDPTSAPSPTMPRAAIQMNAVNYIVEVEHIAPLLIALVN